MNKTETLIQQVLFSTQDSQGRPVVTDASRVSQIVRTLKSHRLLMEEASDTDLMVEFMKRRRAAGEGMLTRAAETETRHVCYYQSEALRSLRNEVVRPGYQPGHVIIEVKDVIANLQGLIRYLEGKGGGTSHLHDRNA